MRPREFGAVQPGPGQPGDRLASVEGGDPAQLLLERVANQMRTPLIIEPRPSLFSPGSLARQVLTLAAWSLWMYLLMPLLTLLAWMIGWKRLSTELLTPEGIGLLMHYLPAYLTVLGLLCGSLIAWALFNWWRFADRERRRETKSPTPEQLALDLRLPLEDMRRWQSMQRLVVQHDEHGHPTGVVEPGQS